MFNTFSLHRLKVKKVECPLEILLLRQCLGASQAVIHSKGRKEKNLSNNFRCLSCFATVENDNKLWYIFQQKTRSSLLEGDEDWYQPKH